jgi:hypothetical protein
MPRVEAGPTPARSSVSLIARIVASAVAFRVVSAVFALLCNLVFPLDQPEQFPSVFGPFRAFWDPFTRYDGGWYYQIARNGYHFVAGGPSVGVGKPGKLAYFPVYPILMRWAGRLFGTSPADVYFGGILVSWLAFVLAMVVLFKLALLDVEDDERAERAVYLAAIFPFAFFFGVVYTEAVFLLFVLAAFYLFRTRWWILGGARDGDAGERDSDSSGACVDRVAPGRAQHQRSPARGRRPCAGRVRHRGVLDLYLRVGRQPLRVGSGDQEMGILPGGNAVDGSRAARPRTGDASARIFDQPAQRPL